MEIIYDNQERNLLDECQKQVDAVFDDINNNNSCSEYTNSAILKLTNCLHWLIQYIRLKEKNIEPIIIRIPDFSEYISLLKEKYNEKENTDATETDNIE